MLELVRRYLFQQAPSIKVPSEGFKMCHIDSIKVLKISPVLMGNDELFSIIKRRGAPPLLRDLLLYSMSAHPRLNYICQTVVRFRRESKISRIGLERKRFSKLVLVFNQLLEFLLKTFLFQFLVKKNEYHWYRYFLRTDEYSLNCCQGLNLEITCLFAG